MLFDAVVRPDAKLSATQAGSHGAPTIWHLVCVEHQQWLRRKQETQTQTFTMK